jgi:hypothetical protein
LRLAGLVSEGLLAAIGEDDAIREARKVCAGCENVLLTPAAADEIPFQVPFFTIVVDPNGVCETSTRARREVERVLLPGGLLMRSLEDQR